MIMTCDITVRKSLRGWIEFYKDERPRMKLNWIEKFKNIEWRYDVQIVKDIKHNLRILDSMWNWIKTGEEENWKILI